MNKIETKNVKIHSDAITAFIAKKPALLLRIGPTLILTILIVLGVYWSLKVNYKIGYTIINSGEDNLKLEVLIDSLDYYKIAGASYVEVIPKERDLVLNAKVINFSSQPSGVSLSLRVISSDDYQRFYKDAVVDGVIMPKSKLALIIENIKSSFKGWK